MSSSRGKVGLLEVVGCLIGGVLLLLALLGGPLFMVVGLAASGLIIVLASITFLGHRRILPVGVSRHGDAVVCRYIPWYEMNAYAMFLVMPLIGISLLAAGLEPGRPVWLRFTGLLVLGAVVLAGYFVIQMWQRSLLEISPNAVTVRLPARGSERTTILRSRIQSITDAEAEVGAAFAPARVTQIAIAYQGADPGTAVQTVLIGPPPGKTAMQLSVNQLNLFSALQAWKDDDVTSPGMMNRVEAILRGKIPNTP